MSGAQVEQLLVLQGQVVDGVPEPNGGLPGPGPMAITGRLDGLKMSLAISEDKEDPSDAAAAFLKSAKLT